MNTPQTKNSPSVSTERIKISIALKCGVVLMDDPKIEEVIAKALAVASSKEQDLISKGLVLSAAEISQQAEVADLWNFVSARIQDHRSDTMEWVPYDFHHTPSLGLNELFERQKNFLTEVFQKYFFKKFSSVGLRFLFDCGRDGFNLTGDIIPSLLKDALESLKEDRRRHEESMDAFGEDPGEDPYKEIYCFFGGLLIELTWGYDPCVQTIQSLSDKGLEDGDIHKLLQVRSYCASGMSVGRAPELIEFLKEHGIQYGSDKRGYFDPKPGYSIKIS